MKKALRRITHKLSGPFITALAGGTVVGLIVGIIVLVLIASPLVGALSGFVFGLVFNDTVAAFLAWSGLAGHGIAFWQVGALLGFSTGFYIVARKSGSSGKS